MSFVKKFILFLVDFFYPVKFYGKENIPNGSAVFTCNHFSAIDSTYVIRGYKQDIRFLAKKELFNNKLFGKILKWFGAIPIDRDNPDIQSLLASIKVLKEGHKLVIFPEGTRNKSGSIKLQEIKGGSVVFAVKAKCPIVPIMILEKAYIFCRNKIIFGKPFTLEQFYDKKLTDELIAQMGQLVYEKMEEQQKLLIGKLPEKKRLKYENFKG